jgi:hypothetical protein
MIERIVPFHTPKPFESFESFESFEPFEWFEPFESFERALLAVVPGEVPYPPAHTAHIRCA